MRLAKSNGEVIELGAAELHTLRTLVNAGGSRHVAASAYWHPSTLNLIHFGLIEWQRVNRAVGIQRLTAAGENASSVSRESTPSVTVLETMTIYHNGGNPK